MHNEYSSTFIGMAYLSKELKALETECIHKFRTTIIWNFIYLILRSMHLY